MGLQAAWVGERVAHGQVRTGSEAVAKGVVESGQGHQRGAAVPDALPRRVAHHQKSSPQEAAPQ
jgi:hypothetical protein